MSPIENTQVSGEVKGEEHLIALRMKDHRVVNRVWF